VSTPPNYEKAKLQIDQGATIDCLFNPTEFTVTKTNTWTYKEIKGNSFPPPQYGGGAPRELSVNLLFDSSLLPPKASVMSICDDLFKMMEVPGGQHAAGAESAPAFLTFSWGKYQGFKAACTSLTVAYQLFNQNGEPIRADVKMTLKQTEPASTASAPTANATTNPSTHSAGLQGIHTVQDGDSLPSIAYKAYGDATRWRSIAEANGVDNPFHLRRGTPLTLPRLEG
jgi:LysM repeat protein